LEKDAKNLNNTITNLKKKLKKYTNGDNHKRYYEKNKEKCKKSSAEYLRKLKIENPSKLKMYSHTAYMNKKMKNSYPDLNIKNENFNFNNPGDPVIKMSFFNSPVGTQNKTDPVPTIGISCSNPASNPGSNPWTI